MLRQIEFLKRLERLQFTGRLVQIDPTGQQWILYVAQGQLIYATGGRHPVRRWRRHLLTYCPRIQTYRLAWQIDLAKVNDSDLHFGWEYALLKYWVDQQRISRQQADQLIQSAIAEVIFDINQSSSVTDQLDPDPLRLSPLNRLQLEAVIEAVELEWQIWQSPDLAGLSPNQAPVIQDLEAFQQWSVEQDCESLVRLINGQRTLRDLAILQHQAVSSLASQLQPCVQLGFIEFAQVADLPGLVFQRNLSQPPPIDPGPKPLIACIDDSMMIRKMMEELLTSSGYQFLGIDDPLRAIGLLLTRKPEFIFLDLVMPNVNGYEICEKLRKLSCFRNTPIVILTSNDGYANRLRSNFVGATDFLSKPLNAEALLSMVDKHLKPANLNDTIPVQSKI